MLIRHVILPAENCAYALRFNDVREVASLGGYSKEREAMERFLVYYFGVELDEPSAWPQTNKCRYDFPCVWRQYKTAIDRMREDGIQVGTTSSHRRLMT